MKIVIAGAGAVGTHLAKLLSKEDQDIILIDENPEKTEHLSNDGSYDLLTLNVSPGSIRGLKEAGVPHADLFIAVTPDEARNITCCMLAHTLGARKTVARVDNSEYIQPHCQEYFRQMGIDSVIYPESLAASDILDGLRRSWARQYWEVHGGALVMLGVKLRQTARILNTPLCQLCTPGTPYHIVAIKRDDDTIIPSGNHDLRLGDIAYFMTTPKYITYLREITGKETYPDVRSVMIMGGGRTSVSLANQRPPHISMKIIEQDEERCQRLSELIDDDEVRIIQGDGRDTHLLLDEGIRSMQAFAALTSHAETNILACLAAKRMGVRKTVALVENTEYVTLAEKLDIGTVINKKTIAASHIYQMMLGDDVANVKSLTIANADVAEFTAAPDSLVTRSLVRNLRLPTGVTLGGLVRNGEGQLIGGNTQIAPGDSVVVFSKSSLIKRLDRYFCRPAGLLDTLARTLR